jgi:hypothetical protein
MSFDSRASRAQAAVVGSDEPSSVTWVAIDKTKLPTAACPTCGTDGALEDLGLEERCMSLRWARSQSCLYFVADDGGVLGRGLRALLGKAAAEDCIGGPGRRRWRPPRARASGTGRTPLRAVM